MTKHYASKPSRLLTAQQNKGIFNALRPNCTSLVTTVAIVYYYINRQWIKQRFGILCIERDAGIKKYFLRFYNLRDMSLLIQQKIKKNGGKQFSAVRDLFFHMLINGRSIAFEFIDNPAGWEESSFVAKALRGNIKKLKREAETRYFNEHPEKQKENRFKRLLHWKDKECKTKLSPNSISALIDPSHVQHDKAAILANDWAVDPVVQVMLKNMGIEVEDAVSNKECRQELDETIIKYGGLQTFKHTVVRNGFASGFEESFGVPPSATPMKQSSSSLPKTPPKVALDTIAGFEPAKEVQVPKNANIGNSLEKVFQEEEFVAPEVPLAAPPPPPPPPPPVKGTTATASAKPTASGTPPEKAAFPSPAKSETPAASDKAAIGTEAATEEGEEVVKPLVPGTLAYDLNLMCQRLTEKRTKREEEERIRREKEAAEKAAKKDKGKAAIPSTTEKSPDKRAPKTLEKSPDKGALKGPEKSPEKGAPKAPEKSPSNETLTTPIKSLDKDDSKEAASLTGTTDDSTASDSDSDSEWD